MLVKCPKLSCKDKNECPHGKLHIKENLRFDDGSPDGCYATYEHDYSEKIICPECELYEIEFLTQEDMKI